MWVVVMVVLGGFFFGFGGLQFGGSVMIRCYG